MAGSRSHSEYNSLVKERNSKRAQYRAAEDRIEDYEYKLERLYRAKQTLVDQKDAFNTIKKDTDKLVDRSVKWKGAQYNTYLEKGEWLSLENKSYYKDSPYSNSLDAVLDSLNDEITRIENLKNNEYGLLGRLGSAINSLCNEIENFFN